jgi:NADPH-dependent 2,4-dienoyl-CoA reductase/sulfur reductase-like enzyme
MSRTAVVVGSSIGGVRTAQSLRSADYPGDVVLVGAEAELPYDKPPLSKAFLAGKQQMRDFTLLTEEDARSEGIRLELGRRAERLRLAEREVELADGTRLRFDDLVIATGARARPSPWGTPPGVHVLRTAADAAALREDLLAGGHLVVIGGGFVGAEVASTARGLGLDVTVVDPLPVPMARVLGTGVGELFGELHRRNGVRTRFARAVEGIRGERGHLEVVLDGGETLTASVVVVGIGARPEDGWLASSGLVLDDGVVCDRFCRARNASSVYAVGDVARWQHPAHGGLVRAEHWTNAVEQALLVAHNITHPDEPRPYAPVGYVWSDQHDWRIQVAGSPGGLPHELVGDPAAEGRFAALYSEDGLTLAGIVTVNWPRALVAARRALSAGTALAELRDALRRGLRP